MSRPRSVALALALGLALATSTSASPAPRTATLIAVGDIATCESNGDEQTAALVSRLPGPIAVLGDIAYPDGSRRDYAACFDPSWGPLTPRIRAALGNHEYYTGTADASIRRFALPQSGWYAYTLGAWRVIVLNSNCDRIGGCGRDSPQWRWLDEELTRSPRRCTLAYWHHPRFSSGLHGSDTAYAHFWDRLARARAELVLSGHDHHYERFAPLEGIRQFVVGTGGARRYPALLPRRGSVVRSSSAWGVLRLTLRPTGYSWRFVPAGDGTFTDAGTAACR